MSVRVSVVVAVYNTGEHIEPLIASLDRQTLPADEFEVIFVDDGSTDETPARLDDLAASRPNVFVLHEPNSGWPGRPRNLGIDRAVGRYVFFVDHDDWLGDEALARMADYADANDSDILIGRYAGHRRSVAKVLFERSHPNATLANAPLIDSLTPHKLFRTKFLRSHGLRFPEGRRRLEDHVFVVRAYFLAERIAVYADYHCYFHIGRTDAGNAGFQRIDPVSYYGYVREVIDIIEEYTEPGSALRLRCLRRPLRQEVLTRLDGKAFLQQDAEYQRELFDAARGVVLDAIPPDTDTGMTLPQQLRAYLLREGRFEDLIAYVRHQVGVRATAELCELGWHEGELVVEFDCRLVGADRVPWRHRRDSTGTYLTVPHFTEPVPPSLVDCSHSPSGSARLFVRRRADSEEWPVPVDSSSTTRCDDSGEWAEQHASAKLDPRRLAAGQPLSPGVWDVYAVASNTGWVKQVRLGSTRTERATQGCRSTVLGTFAVVPYWTTPHQNLSLNVGASPKTLASRAAPGIGDIRVQHAQRERELLVRVPLVAAAASASAAQVRLDRLDRTDSRLLAASTRVLPDEIELSAGLPRLRGQWAVFVQPGVAAWGSPARTGTMLSFARSGVVTVSPQPTGAAADRADNRADRVRRTATRYARGAWRRLDRLRRKLSQRA